MALLLLFLHGGGDSFEGDSCRRMTALNKEANVRVIPYHRAAGLFLGVNARKDIEGWGSLEDTSFERRDERNVGYKLLSDMLESAKYLEATESLSEATINRRLVIHPATLPFLLSRRPVRSL